MSHPSLSRRRFLQGSAAAGVGLAVLGSAEPLLAGSPAATEHFAAGAGYGPLVPDPAGLLDLPAGFRYQVVAEAGGALTDSSGRAVAGRAPGKLDGTAAFAASKGSTLLVVNHEQGDEADFPAEAAADLTYDPLALGGTSTILVDRRNQRQGQYVSLAGTWSNCAGGPTPWGTWLTCEETEQLADGEVAARDHGFVFEVHPRLPEQNLVPTPLTAMGRFAHEAVAVDPVRGHAYLTEDASAPNGLFYRFTPADRRRRYGAYRAGGLLEAALLPDLADLSKETRIGARHHVVWRAVPDPLAESESIRKQFSYGEGAARVSGPGGDVTRSRKLEGIYWQNGLVYVVASYARLDDGSAAEHDGQVWAFDPRRSTMELLVRYAVNQDPESDAPDGPDNITVTPSGGMVLAEDGEGTSHVLGVNRWGESFLIARNPVDTTEFTGPTFSANGQTLFVNLQTPGTLFAITGPWKQGSRAL